MQGSAEPWMRSTRRAQQTPQAHLHAPPGHERPQRKDNLRETTTRGEGGPEGNANAARTLQCMAHKETSKQSLDVDLAFLAKVPQSPTLNWVPHGTDEAQP